MLKIQDLAGKILKIQDLAGKILKIQDLATHHMITHRRNSRRVTHRIGGPRRALPFPLSQDFWHFYDTFLRL